MSAFALVIGLEHDGPDAQARRFIDLVGGFKSLGSTDQLLHGNGCVAAKFTSASSLHGQATIDEATGSWLLAVGSLFDGAGTDVNLGPLLRDLLAQGPDVLARCDGQFAAVFYNGTTGEVSVITDPLGYFAVFEGTRDGRTFVASSALAIASILESPPDPTGVECFLLTGKVFGPLTLWGNVRRMPAATVRTFGSGPVRSVTYWEPTLDERLSRLPLDEAIESSAAVIEATLARQLAPESTVWSDLTGGFDTRLLSLFLARAGVPFEANVVGPARHPDVRIALEVARTMGWRCEWFQLPGSWAGEGAERARAALGHGDGHLDVLSTLRALWVHEQEGRRHAALLSGLGGELWRGPIWWPERARLGRSTTVHYERQLWSLLHPVDASVFADDPRQRVRAELIHQFRDAGEREPGWPNTAKLDRLWAYRETAHAGAWLSLGAGLVRLRTPLFSTDIVRHVMSLDHRWKSGNRVVRGLFARYAPPLAAIEIEGRGPAGPRTLGNAHRFVPSRLRKAGLVVDKAAQVIVRRRLLPTDGHEGAAQGTWRRSLVESFTRDGTLAVGTMHSAPLYRPERLEAFFGEATREGFRGGDLLGRILTVELALRATGARIER